MASMAYGDMPERYRASISMDDLEVAPPRRRILAYGDSLTAGFCDDGDRFEPYGSVFCEALAPAIDAEVFVCGLSGLEAADMAMTLTRRKIEDCVGRVGSGLRRILVEEGPFDLVLIMAGTNDLGDPKQPAAPIATTVKALHTACHCEGVRTVVLSVPPSDGLLSDRSYQKRWSRVNSLLKTWALGEGVQEGVALYVDTATIVPFETGRFWEDDGLHLSPSGSAHLGSSLARLLVPLLAEIPPSLSANEEAFGGPMPQLISAKLPAQFRILCYGDSLTAGYHAFGSLFAPYAATLIHNLLPDIAAEAWVCGLSAVTAKVMANDSESASIKDGVRRMGQGITRILKEHGPFDLALIMAGTNDLSKSKPDRIFADVKALHVACHNVGTRTLALSVPPSRAALKSKSISPCRSRVNELLREWLSSSDASSTPGMFLDMDDIMPYDDDDELWEIDGLHFSRDGSRQLGIRLAPLVKAALCSKKNSQA
eukprot:TRINITY_DN65746_c0_g1_i1.p1 TRINITY_DN65746_c0_g1~~TRINITY_DN65746_c0_g1_i1.p1  ORF type:complete len:495 (-),score=65.56 TRINITY_DN65746_c0_g1_i1:203-1651(-)